MLFNFAHKDKLFLILRWIILLGTFTYVLGTIDWSQASSIFKQMHGFWIGLGFLGSFITLIPMAKRCAYLLSAATVSYSFLKSYSAYISGTFVGLALPGVIGGDVFRIFYCNRNSSATLLLASAVILIERILGVAALILLLNLGIHSLHSGKIIQLKMMMFFLAITAVVTILFLPQLLQRLPSAKKSEKKALLHSIQTKIGQWSEKLSFLKSMTAYHLLTGLGLSVMAQFMDVLVTYILSRGLGFDIPFPILLVIVPFSYLLTILPLTPGSLGIRESVFVFTMNHWFDISASDAALMAFVVFLTRVGIGLVGGILLIQTKNIKKDLKNKMMLKNYFLTKKIKQL
ncbi:Uncharacterised protein family (UPF0104) [Legionella wadsworthii]|uniref:Integral membrane protein n=1 Tax=Legionella wadsworthii TaxID=28088 RepID=A0A378LXR4_9GAMM|nr:lysylphosphatidylglycerol synthase transmembrane domain-containing protein [Legionella wadsworthii]STY31208.1 Uncharacterised protein family (UPF0104) [Legionella wadsworthii]